MKVMKEMIRVCHYFISSFTFLISFISFISHLD